MSPCLLVAAGVLYRARITLGTTSYTITSATVSQHGSSDGCYPRCMCLPLPACGLLAGHPPTNSSHPQPVITFTPGELADGMVEIGELCGNTWSTTGQWVSAGGSSPWQAGPDVQMDPCPST